MRVEHMNNPSNVVLTDTLGNIHFFSYGTHICTLFPDGKILTITNAWDYSRTTTKYFYQFLRIYSSEQIQTKSGNIPFYDIMTSDNKLIKSHVELFIRLYGSLDVLSAGAKNGN